MRKRVNFLLRAVAGVQNRCLVVNRYPGAGEVAGAPVVELTLDADATVASCVLDADVMWQAVLVNIRPSGTRSTHSVVFNTAKNLLVDKNDTAHSDTFRIESIADEVEKVEPPLWVEPVVEPVVEPEPEVISEEDEPETASDEEESVEIDDI